MKRLASAMRVAGIGLCLAGCGIDQGAQLRAQQEATAQKAREITWAATLAEAAIKECREKRLRKELKTYKESIECSNPKVYKAWQEAGAPDLDLLSVWLAARLVCGESIDKGKATEAECELQLAELRSRLANEGQRRVQAAAQTQAMQAQAAAQAQAANAQSAAALLQGLAALQTANRPTYTINCTTTGVNTCLYPQPH
jgi:hypothetical protein